MHRRLISYIIIIFACSSSLFATGPSNMISLIRPISINDKGDILCRTKFRQNPMGGYSPQHVEYGLCVITSDSIVFQDALTIKGSMYIDEDRYWTDIQHWDSIFNSDSFILSDLEYRLIHKYDFKEANTKKYLRNDTVSIKQFIADNNFNDSIPQFALYNAIGHFHEYPKSLVISYDFGNICFISNYDNGDDFSGESALGARFSYSLNIAGATEYEIYEITGILFRNKTNNLTIYQPQTYNHE